jgi:TolB-like protein
MSLISELKRRQVVQVAIAYVVVAWGIAQVSELILETYEVQPWAMQTILATLGLGFPLAIALSWIFDLRWDGLHRESDLAEGSTAALVPFQQIENETIAVLSFADMSPDKDQEYFSDGISEELLNLLAKVPQLRVAARTSAFSYKGTDTKIKDIGRELSVAHVLEGSVRKAGNSIRITAQLIKAENGYHLWSETWDRTLDDIFAVQDEIAVAVVEQLKLTLLTSAPAISETDPEAYALFLQARSLYRQYTASAFDNAICLLDQIPDSVQAYAPAWALRSEIYASQSNYGFHALDDGYCMARAAAERALSIDPNCTQAICSLARIAFDYDRDLAVAAQHYNFALAIDPIDPDLLRNSASLSAVLNNLDSAIELLVYLVARDPVNPALHNNLGALYYFAGRSEEAILSCRTALQLSPGRIGMHYIVAMALLTLGEIKAALKASEYEENSGFRLTVQALAYHELGQRTNSDTALTQLIEEEAHEFAYNIGFVLACRGETTQAFEWLDKALEYHDGGLGMIRSEPSFVALHTDPRWGSFMTKIGQSKVQLEAIEFDVKLPFRGGS